MKAAKENNGTTPRYLPNRGAGKNRVLIIGKMPPPVGGVRVHVKRLMERMEDEPRVASEFYNLEEATVTGLLRRLRSYPLVHLHTSNPYLQCGLALVCRLCSRKLLITYHGDLGRYSGWKALAEQVSVRLCSVPLVQNRGSLRAAVARNRNARIVTAYLRPRYVEQLPSRTQRNLTLFCARWKPVCCTNASGLTFDKKGREIYGITTLVDHFSRIQPAGLVISDPTGNYGSYIAGRGALPENICFISEPHDFMAVMRNCHVFIRNTTTDGDSLSVHEALHQGLTVFASDVVSRPEGCVLFRDVRELVPEYMGRAVSAGRDDIDAGYRALLGLYLEHTGPG